jgi:hypothetical protein
MTTPTPAPAPAPAAYPVDTGDGHDTRITPMWPVLEVSPFATLLLLHSMETLCDEEDGDEGWEYLHLLDTLRHRGWWCDLSDAELDTLYEYHRTPVRGRMERSGFADLLRPGGVRPALRRRVVWSLWCAHLADTDGRDH